MASVTHTNAKGRSHNPIFPPLLHNALQSPAARSYAAAAATSVASSHFRPTSWRPMGRPATVPHGTETDGCPLTSNGFRLEHISSARAADSSTGASCTGTRVATIGVEGRRRTSTERRAASYAAVSRRRAFCACAWYVPRVVVRSSSPARAQPLRGGEKASACARHPTPCASTRDGMYRPAQLWPGGQHSRCQGRGGKQRKQGNDEFVP